MYFSVSCLDHKIDHLSQFVLVEGSPNMLSLNLPFLVCRSERKRFTEPAIIDAELFACLVEKLVFIDIEVI